MTLVSMSSEIKHTKFVNLEYYYDEIQSILVQAN